MKKPYLALFFLLVLSCSKSDLYTPNISSEDNDVSIPSFLKFSSLEELGNEKKQITNMTLEERKEYEELKGFISFGRKCDEIYFRIDPEKLKSVDELYEYVKENSKYVLIERDKNGELENKTVCVNSQYYYIANEEGLFQVGDDIYKIFDDGLALTNKNNLTLLRNTQSNTLSSLADNELIKLLPNEITGEDNYYQKDSENNCGRYKTDTTYRDNERTVMTISASSTFSQYKIGYAVDILIKPSKKTLGIWFNVRRTIDCLLLAQLDYINTDDEWDLKLSYGGNPLSITQTTYRINQTIIYFETSSVTPWNNHLGAIDCWADTPSTSPVIIQCNQDIL